MSIKQKKRGIRLISILLLLCTAVGLVIFALSKNLHLFYTPTEVATHSVKLPAVFRMGGMVLANSVHRHGLEVEFQITDYAHSVPVHYHGILPDLFREGQGIVVLGSYKQDSGVLEASEVLAKHDENYMPVEAKKAIQAARLTQKEEPKP